MTKTVYIASPEKAWKIDGMSHDSLLEALVTEGFEVPDSLKNAGNYLYVGKDYFMPDSSSVVLNVGWYIANVHLGGNSHHGGNMVRLKEFRGHEIKDMVKLHQDYRPKFALVEPKFADLVKAEYEDLGYKVEMLKHR